MSEIVPLHIVVDSLNSDKSFLDYLSAFLTPVIAVVTTYIAIQQYKLSHRQFRQESYERRFKVYKVVQQFLSDIVSRGGTNYAKLTAFYSEASEAAFLFDPSVQTYIELLYSKGIDLAHAREKLYPEDGSQGVQGEERGKYARESGELVKWFYKQLSESQEMFRKQIGIAG